MNKSFDVKNSVEQKDKSAVLFVDFCGGTASHREDGEVWSILFYWLMLQYKLI